MPKRLIQIQSTPKKKKKAILPPEQKRISDFFQKPGIKGKNSVPSQSERSSQESQSQRDNFVKAQNKLIEMVKNHQLNEIIEMFSLTEGFQLQFSRVELKSLYDILQVEMQEEFGAPLSRSLFPKLIFEPIISSE